MKEQKKKRHIEGMDALRGFAILGVVLYHVMPGRFPGGFLGVNMFLVLSGYLIYKTSVWDLEHGKYAAGRFYKKRCIRIYPPPGFARMPGTVRWEHRLRYLRSCPFWRSVCRRWQRARAVRF